MAVAASITLGYVGAEIWLRRTSSALSLQGERSLPPDQQSGSAVPIAAAVSNLPAPIHAVVFAESQFASPIAIRLPNDLSQRDEQSYAQALRTSTLPPIPPSGQLSDIRPDDLRDYLQVSNFITVFELPSRIGSPIRYFRYSDQANEHITQQDAGRVLRIAVRQLKAIDYVNEYRMNPAGTGEREVYALTFSYVVVPTIPGATAPVHAYQGEAKAIRDPDTGRWSLSTFNLAHPEPLALLGELVRDSLDRFRQQRTIEEAAAREQAERERAARISSLANEREELGKALDWADPPELILDEAVNVRLPTGRSVRGRLVAWTDGISIQSPESSGRWQFWKIGSPELLPWPFDDRLRISRGGGRELELTDSKPAMKQLLSRLHSVFTEWANSERGRAQIAARQRLGEIDGELGGLQRQAR